MAKRILILMSDTGGGHRASAEALQAVFTERYGQRFEVILIDLWTDYTRWPLNQIPKTYRFLVNNALWLWKLFWRASERTWLVDLIFRLVGRWSEHPMRLAFRRYDADLIISVHPLMQDIPLTILRRMKKQVPFVTVITDLASINPTWFDPDVDLCFVASEEAYRRGLKAKMRPEQLRLLGLPIRPAFAKPADAPETLRRRLGLCANRLTVLLVGGGEGMGPVAEIAQHVADQLAADGRAAQVVVICGRNRKLQKQLSSRAWPIPTHVQGFVKNMPEWMTASDCIITKAGPGTIAEALTCGLPIVLSGYIAGQEEGNVPYVVENGVGAYNEDPAQIAAIVSRWFGPEREKRTEMARKAKEMGRPQATYAIVEEIAKLLDGQHVE